MSHEPVIKPLHPWARKVAKVTTDDDWPAPDRSLVREDRSAAPDFDWDAVPAAWRSWVRDTAGDCSAPPDYVFAGLCAVFSAALGNARRVSPWDGWVEPPHLWFALVGNPSSGKTPALRPLRDAARALEKTEEAAHEQALAIHERDAAAADAIRGKWGDEVKDAVKAGRPPPDRPAAAVAPQRPILPRLVVSNSTVEALAELLAGNQRGLLLDRDELAGLIGQFDKYGGAGDDRAFYLEAWNGGRFVVDRKSLKGVPLRIPFASLAIVGGIQPDRLREIHQGTDDGLAARFLYVWPDSVSPSRPTAAGWNDRRRYLENALSRLRGLSFDHGADGEPVAQLVPVAEPALKILDEIRREVAAANRDDVGLMAGWRGKTPGRLLRLALVLQYMEWAVSGEEEPQEVSEGAMRQAADYLDYLGAMFERVLGDMALDAATRDAAQVARWIMANRPVSVNGRELSKERGFSRLRSPEARQAALRMLTDAGWIRQAPALGRAGRTADGWQVNPTLFAGA